MIATTVIKIRANKANKDNDDKNTNNNTKTRTITITKTLVSTNIIVEQKK